MTPSDIPDFPWETLIIFGCVFYGIMLLIMQEILRQPEPRRCTFECRCGLDWHDRCPDPDLCECECHEY